MFRILIIYLFLFSHGFSQIVEHPDNPIYNPYPDASFSADYCPSIAYDSEQFSNHGERAFYKLWHEGPHGLVLSTSNDGIHWQISKETSLLGTHPVVIYDENGFADGKYFYKIWFWTGVGGETPDVIQYSQSVDGENWQPPVPIEQDLTAPLVFGEAGSPFFNLYGPGFVLYNPDATLIEDEPYTYPYIMFYDAVSGKTESIGLAYSQDGIVWKRYAAPILLPSSNWDGTNVFRPHVIKIGPLFHMFYCGSNESIGIGETVSYGHGIGHAVSKDGIHWVKDDNPLLIYSQEVEWRSGRTYRPMIVVDTTSSIKIWFVGGRGGEAGKEQGIGFALFHNKRP